MCSLNILFYAADVAELADALVLGANTEVCRFKSCHPHHSLKAAATSDCFLSFLSSFCSFVSDSNEYL